jgi:hypothetical protein
MLLQREVNQIACRGVQRVKFDTLMALAGR